MSSKAIVQEKAITGDTIRLQQHPKPGRWMYYDGGFGFICKKFTLERWTDFEVAWRKLAMQRWEIDASKGDSENFRYGWGLDFIKIKEQIGVKDLPRLRTATPNMLDDDSPSNWLPSRMNVFYFVDDEVVDSVLEGPSKAEIPFIYAVAGTYFEDEDIEFDPLGPFGRGVCKVAVEVSTNFW